MFYAFMVEEARVTWPGMEE